MMTIQATHFTPEVLLSAPRRSPAVPNPTGDLILYTVSTYSFETHSKSSQIRVRDVKETSSYVVADDPAAHEPVWISDAEILYLVPGKNGSTSLMRLDVKNHPSDPELVYNSPGALSNPKVKLVSEEEVIFCCSAPTLPSGKLFCEASEPKAHSSAKIYDSLMVRHWDTWLTKNRNSLWYGLLKKGDGKWELKGSRLTNLLAGTQLSSPVPPFGGTGDFDISSKGIAFVAKDPKLNEARHTKTDLYYVPIKDFGNELGTLPQVVMTGQLRGYSNSPTFSKDGKKLAFTRMKSDRYESDKTRLLLIPDIEDLSNVQEFYETEDGKGAWELRPDWIVWSNDGRELYVSAEQYGRAVLWKMPASPRHATQVPPEAIHEDGCLIDAKPLGSYNSLFITRRSRVESSSFAILDPNTKSVTEVSSSSKHGKSFGLRHSQCHDVWFAGAGGYDIHALVMRPSNFDPSKKYPLALLIHGGPQGAWADDWSTRWNPAIFAEQGYVVVCPNVTGSTGYGQDHVDAITKNWGGTPYEDLVKCFEYVEKKMPYVDTDRSVALGASYGGYMINWIQGHELGRKFKALVCHDGVFSTRNQYQTEELFFPEHDFGGTPWENTEYYDKWDPSRFSKNWETPMLVIHSELDYRLPIGEGLSMFNILQAREVPSQLLVFPDENHWVLKPENSLVWHKTVLDFINKFAGVEKEAE